MLLFNIGSRPKPRVSNLASYFATTNWEQWFRFLQWQNTARNDHSPVFAKITNSCLFYLDRKALGTVEAKA